MSTIADLPLVVRRLRDLAAFLDHEGTSTNAVEILESCADWLAGLHGDLFAPRDELPIVRFSAASNCRQP